MGFSLQVLWRTLRGPEPRLICNKALWSAGVAELRKRTRGRQEAGAFLLGPAASANRHIKHFLFYDDIDPHCFDNGIVEFNGALLGQVWSQCRALGLTVAADVHVHPGHYGQSPSDKANPIMPEAGHIALILPNYARDECLPGTIGLYEYLGSRKWADHSNEGRAFFRVGGLW